MRDAFGGSATFEAKQEARFVVFRLGNEKFAARIERVREVLVIEHVTPIPRVPDYILGVLNLRGMVTTIIDLRRRLSIRKFKEFAEIDNRTVVVVEVGKRAIGMAVDDVDSITPIPFDAIEPNIDMINKDIHSPFLEGVAKIGEELIILLNLEIIFSEFEVEQIYDVTDSEATKEAELDDGFSVTMEEMELPTASSIEGTAKVPENKVSDMVESAKESEEEERPKLKKSDLEKKKKAELVTMASKLGISDAERKKKDQLVEMILKPQEEV